MNPFFFFVSLRAKGERIATAAAQPRNDILNYDTRLSL